MNKMISVSSGFQYSVNIAYDLYDDNKLKNFIPTRSSLLLLESILLSTDDDSTNRARILVGAYGKGKSHIVLTILSVLMQRDYRLFEKLSEKLTDFPKINQLVHNYYDSNKKIFPIIITGANTSLTQAFILSMQRALSESNLTDIMPETNYQAAVSTIERWSKEFPDTLVEFERLADTKHQNFIKLLKNYDVDSYRLFEELYPLLTSGSTFNPFLGFDVVELYESVAKGLKEKGYSGVYVVYDEFSKYLEANIKTASVSDTKMLQDFAEKCNRSGSLQMHLMLISHKEIANYIDVLPKQKVDGWRGISERFEHVHLNNNFSQTYEIIRTVIRQDKDLWEVFYRKNEGIFTDLYKTYNQHQIFSDTSKEDIKLTIEGSYPLHPVSTFILPRLSERIAQNERTLFTFLSAKGENTLSSILDERIDNKIEFVTPDQIFDYFEPLFKKEVYSDTLHEQYVLTKKILERIEENDLETRIIKTISLIYILEQFEKLSPTPAEIVKIFSIKYSKDDVSSAIENLINNECVVYLKRNNGFLKLKETSGINIREKINEVVEKEKNSLRIKDVLNDNNFDSYMYPAKYNDEREMTRFFSFEFIDSKEVDETINWEQKMASLNNDNADGFVLAIIPSEDGEIERVKRILTTNSYKSERCIFVSPKVFESIEDIIYEFNAVTILKDQSVDDKVLFDEYEVIYEDLLDVINKYIGKYTRPENNSSLYIYNSKKQDINRKSDLTGLLSNICNSIFSKTPVINNEVINKNEITGVATNSRNKIITALLRNELDTNLGLNGSGQEVSIMRSTLIMTGILTLDTYPVQLNFNTQDEYMQDMLFGILDFVFKAKKNGKVEFREIYDYLTLPEFNIGLRRGLIPIYLSVVFHNYKQEIVIKSNSGQIPLNADTIEQINADPESFSLHYLEWNEDKEQFVARMEQLFAPYVIQSEKLLNSYDYIVSAMKRWYLSLPKFTKDSKKKIDGNKIDKRYLALLNSLRSGLNGQDLLFEHLPKEYGYSEFNVGVIENIEKSKMFFDNLLEETKQLLLNEVQDSFANGVKINKDASISSTVRDWLETLNDNIYNHVFNNGTEKCLMLFKNITADSDAFIVRLAKLATDLRIEDWNNDTYLKFKNRIVEYKETAEAYTEDANVTLKDDINTIQANQYQLSFYDNDGRVKVKRFDKVERSKRSNLLYNAVEAQLLSMGQSISESEKRQVLMELLSKLLQ
ncbi:hypothetical protein C4N15_09255 [Fusobacterium necrophorum subsp. funduliforme]|uniref:hypothetical protein n=1 Tax=Fusobacterium necrophorum TaxID=859 RepID=UPI000D11C008|nr:hypothetical protein [Fusobacterium necrophorum]AVQ21821.1 hypothetical protein C4N15_09255 [Fusobacterium necrophorum subsp. funduliforme]MBR8721909.1 hypothetical protein [Fusobacterium necrophorum subsp. funduliforme]